MPCIRLVGRTKLHLPPTIVALLQNSKTTRKQIKMIAHVVSTGLDIKTRVITPALQEVATTIVATSATHEISPMLGVTDALQTKPIGSQPSVRT